MRRAGVLLGVAFLALASAARAAPVGYAEAQASFDGMPTNLRQFAQVLLVSAGYTNAIVTQQFSNWMPFDLETHTTEKGFVFKDRQGRFGLKSVALPNVPGGAAYDDLVAKKIGAGETITVARTLA